MNAEVPIKWNNGTPIPIAIGIIGGNVEEFRRIPAPNDPPTCRSSRTAEQLNAVRQLAGRLAGAYPR